MLNKLLYLMIVAGIAGVLLAANPTNAQYEEIWNGGLYLFIGCENTDYDPAKEVVFFYSGGGIAIIDGETGIEEWNSGLWHLIRDRVTETQLTNVQNPVYPRLIDVDGDGRYEILFAGQKTSSDPLAWYLYGYAGGGVKESSYKNIPKKPVVAQNYPNPFNPATTINYAVAKKGNVSLKIYNVTGQLVRTLVNESKRPGDYTARWGAKDDYGAKVVTGIYFYQLTVGDFTCAKKAILLK